MKNNEFIKELLKANDKFEENTKKGMSDINIFEALGVQEMEIYHSKFIAYLIDPHDDHYQELFANEFLKKLGRYTKAKKFKNLTAHDIESVETEACAKDNRRIDILISLKDKRYIIIENKLKAKDQPNQLKDYIKHIKEKVKNIDDFHENILTIYLHKNEDTEPSKYSLGTRNGFKINDDLIYGSNDKKMSYYLKLDYKWIKEWINACIGVCENKVKNNEIDKKFKNDMQNVIFTLNQYKTLLTWYVAIDDYVAKDYVMEFLKSSKENLNNATNLYRYTKNKSDFKDVDNDKYKKAKEIVREKWDEICEELMSEFMDKLEKKFKNKKIRKNIFLVEKYHDKINLTKNFFTVYHEKDIDGTIIPTFNLYFCGKNYKNLRIDFCITYYYENDEERKEYDEKIKNFKSAIQKIIQEIKNQNLNILKASIFKKIILGEKNQDIDYEFIYDMIDYDKTTKDDKFKTIEDYIYNEIKNFIENDTIEKALNKAKKVLKS
ncbi:PD-(D/E)XK nuclease family protein [Campylobacter sp. RKI_CA19_01128]|uniref:PDDEXK-like family protein n=1 Tax=unclassified Campylobacter TaxID=2593542 RepID=UPI0021E7C5BA|nr:MULTISPECIES: PD-(D/E)XK nuclease family protein [unclassified Campylobacter]MCV3349761.1 PD-(D/E)XK nuclease family protein [Campylobacter sp. RKI_CA19_01127]MCV3355729.1 PD-(D/E)XK nuclease family protein [Campylobacter sp. RKI_CA19_01128]HEC1777143.1 PD-(D/E)XK nuclease family protein [Campylobacter lari]